MRPIQTFMAPYFAFVAVVAAPMLWAPAASAQSRADPADPAARVPAATHRSPFADYRLIGEEPVGDWRAANDEVGRIGGWREYAREAQAPETTPGAAPTKPPPGVTPAKPAPGASPQGAHGGHSMPDGKQ